MPSPARSALLCFSCALAACTPAPYVVLQFPDAQAETDAAELSLYALSPLMDCDALMVGGKVDTWLLSVTTKLPLTEPAHLGKLGRGEALFFAEVRDKNGVPFLRGCSPAVSGSEVVLVLQRILKPLRVREGDTLVVDVIANDASGRPFKLAAPDAPAFVKYDEAARKLFVTPSASDQGAYLFDLVPAETVAGSYPQRVELTVEDVPRPLKWDRLYRGWHGRFDAAVLWDPEYNQLFATGGRDDGVDLAKPKHTLFITSNAPDVRNDYRVLLFPDDGGTPDWRPNQLLRSSTGGKFGHVMGYVRVGRQPTGTKLGFILGGSDGSQLSGESLTFPPSQRNTFATSPTALLNPQAAFRIGMASAIEPDFTATYLFGGDLGLTQYTNELLMVSAPDIGQLRIDTVPVVGPARPLPRSNAAMVMALNPKRLVVIGGHNTDYPQELMSDAWVICLEEAAPKCPPGSAFVWKRVLDASGAFPGAGSAGVFGLVAGYDVANDRVITYGGLGVSSADQAYLYEDAFELDLSGSTISADGGVVASFVKLPAPGGPYGIVAGAAAQDTDGGRLLIYSGLSGRLINGTAQLDMTEDVWVLGLTKGNEKLTKLSPASAPPAPNRRVAGNIISRGPMVFGGQSEGFDPLDEWLIQPDGGVTQVTHPGISPLPRANMSVAYNPDRDEYWMYGGRVGSLLPTAALFRLRADAGYQAFEQLGIGSRFGPASAYDERNHRLVVFGGIGIDDLGGSTSLNDVLALSLQNETLVTEKIVPHGTTAPLPRYGAIAGYDRAGQRLLVFGGTSTQSGGGDIDSSEVWQLSLVPGAEEWRQIETMGTPPDQMYLPAAAWTRGNPPQLYVLGTVKRSNGKYEFVDKLWRLTLDTSPTWVELTRPDFRPRPRIFPSFTYDDQEHKLLMCCGATDPVFRNDVWTLTLP